MRSTLNVERGRRTGLRVDAGRVRAARLAAGLSLADVAGDELSRTMVHFVETGRARPSRAVLRVIARRTHKPMGYFLLGGNEDAPDADGTTLAHRLSSAGDYVRRFAEIRRLAGPEREAMTLVEVAIRHAAILAESIERAGGGRGTRGRKHP